METAGKQIIVYLLQLTDGKYYVGQTDQTEARFNEHLAGLGSKWTRLHKPIKLFRTTEILVTNTPEAMLYENWMTLHYMEQYGWKNVRGGDFVILEEYLLKEKIRNVFNTSTNKINYYLESPYLFGTTEKTGVLSKRFSAKITFISSLMVDKSN